MADGQSKSKLPCSKCGSSDAVTLYPKGDAYCFSCEHFYPVGEYEADDCPFDADPEPNKTLSHKPELGVPHDIPSRGLKKATLAHFGVGYNAELDRAEYPVYSGGTFSAYKLKDYKDKKFGGTGSLKNPDFFGQHLAGNGGKFLIVTEGEDDAMAAHQMLAEQGKAYRVVSLPSGANLRAVKDHLEWLESFETIVLNLDNDESGRECAEKMAQMMTPGKCKIMQLPNNIKDNNDLMLSSKTASSGYMRRLNNAQPYRPDGIIATSKSNILQYLKESDERGPSIPYPWSGLNRYLYGMREREIVTWTAGTGIGKSAVMREIEHHLLQTTLDNVGILALEESVDRSMWGVLSVEANLPLAIKEERDNRGITWDSPEVAKWIDGSKMVDRMQILDHWGSTAEDNLMNKVRFMIRGLGCKHVILDHLSIVVSGMDVREDERKTIDRIMTQLRQLTEETGASLHLVAHLRRIEGGRSHEQGMEVGLSHLRGSQAIAQLSDAVVAMERNQQADDEKEANLTRLRVLKNRYAGPAGLACHLAYDRETGRLKEIFNVDEYLAPPVEEAGC